jgi:hypothetical protein
MNFIDLLQLFCAALAILTIVRIAIDAVREAYERRDE